MISIPLTQGKIAIIDEIDGDLAEKRWQAMRCRDNWYAKRSLPGMKATSMHREIATRFYGGKIPRHLVVDHINHDGLDNRRSNLRVVTGKDNILNCKEVHWVFTRGW